MTSASDATKRDFIVGVAQPIRVGMVAGMVIAWPDVPACPEIQADSRRSGHRHKAGNAARTDGLKGMIFPDFAIIRLL